VAPGAHGTTAAEAAAVDREPACPRLRHARHEQQQQRRGDGGHQPRADPGEQQQAEGDLEERQHRGDDVDRGARQHVVRADGDDGLVQIDRLEGARDQPDGREAQARQRADQIENLRPTHTFRVASPPVHDR
jgi:hypothetical protein